MAGCSIYATDNATVVRDTNCNILPGVFRSFYGSYNLTEEKTELNWNVLNNSSVNSFNPERSMDGRNFENAGIIFSNGASGDALYKYFDDISPFLTPFVDYRVRLNNKDGSYVYSKVLHINRTLAMREGLIIAPNPVRDKF